MRTNNKSRSANNRSNNTIRILLSHSTAHSEFIESEFAIKSLVERGARSAAYAAIHNALISALSCDMIQSSRIEVQRRKAPFRDTKDMDGLSSLLKRLSFHNLFTKSYFFHQYLPERQNCVQTPMGSQGEAQRQIIQSRSQMKHFQFGSGDVSSLLA